MNRILSFLLALVCATAFASGWAQTRTLAFPGADGYGRYATGGRGGEVCYVTRLDDCTDDNLVEGTLRWALRHNNGGRPRTVLFATSGTIYLTSKLKLQYPNVSILGQTAPGGGITLTGYNLYICRNNVIVRYLRFRAGDIPNQSMTGLDIENADRVILDHCSMTWSMEECLTAYDTDSTTIQWCIIGEGLYNSKNSKGARAYATQWGGEHSTMHHTLITNSHSRAPRFNGVRAPSGVKGEHDYQVDSEFANNVVFNWSGAGNQYGGEYDKAKVEVNYWTRNDPGYNRVYLMHNFYRPGPATKKNCGSKRYWCAPSSPYGQWYLEGNKFEVGGTYSTGSGVWSQTELDKVNADNYYGAESGSSSRGIDLTGSNFTKFVMSELPYSLSGMEYESADVAYQRVVTGAGASLPRYDEVDTRLLAEAAGTVEPKYHGPSINELGIIDSPSDVTLTNPDAYVVDGETYYDMPRMFVEGTDRFFVDSDKDGMPDGYEDEYGLDKFDATDGSQLAANGYTHLENYLNAVADGQIAPNAYCTSLTYVEPGPQEEAPETVTYTFTKGGVACDGTAPAAITAPYGEEITIPLNHTLYREGYTLSQWSTGMTMVRPGDRYSYHRDVTLTPSFTSNKLDLAERTQDVTLVWDFTAADAPTLSGTGIYVTQASYADASQDVRLTYSGRQLTLPACPGATYSLVGATTVSGTAEGEQVTVEAPEALTSVTVVLPYLKDNDQPASGPASITWAWNGQQTDAVVSPKGMFPTNSSIPGSLYNITGESKAFNKAFLGLQPSEARTELDAATGAVTFRFSPADGIAFQPEQLRFSAVKQGTDAGRWTITLQQGQGEEHVIVSDLNPARNNATTYTAGDYDLRALATSQCSEVIVRFYLLSANPAKVYGLADIEVNGTYNGAAPVAKQYTFNAVASPAEAATISWTPAGNRFDEGTELTVEAVAAPGYHFVDWRDQTGAVRSTTPQFSLQLNADTELTAHYMSDDDLGYIFRNVQPYDAVVSNVLELTTALQAAADRADKTQRYRIYLRSGVYDFGTKAKTAIPAMTSLVGEGQDQVLIMNNPGAVTNYQEQTPVLYVDQNQNDVYLQDLTIRQARDWDTQRSQGQAIAVRQRGKRAVYKNVTLQGVQDTYYLNKADATAYFEDCSLSGEVDFIYGDGTAWFEQCLLHPLSGNACITASNAQAGHKGFVFDHCTIDGASGYRLGRPWSDSPAATYLYTTMRSLPNAAGWGSMTSGLKVRFHEYASMDADGQPLDLSSRSIAACQAAAGSDAPVLTDEQAAAYTLGTTFRDWDPAARAHQLEAPVIDYGTCMITEPSEGAIGYVVYLNGKAMQFYANGSDVTYDPQWEGLITVRAINEMGGLSVPSNALDLHASIEPLEADRTPSTRCYNLFGQPLRQGSASGIVVAGQKVLLVR